MFGANPLPIDKHSTGFIGFGNQMFRYGNQTLDCHYQKFSSHNCLSIIKVLCCSKQARFSVYGALEVTGKKRFFFINYSIIF